MITNFQILLSNEGEDAVKTSQQEVCFVLFLFSLGCIRAGIPAGSALCSTY